MSLETHQTNIPVQKKKLKILIAQMQTFIELIDLEEDGELIKACKIFIQ